VAVFGEDTSDTVAATKVAIGDPWGGPTGSFHTGGRGGTPPLSPANSAPSGSSTATAGG
jgi:hypothetical protein